MFFNSIEFAIFLPIVFTLYWLFAKNNLKIQNLILLVSSYVFYGWWDYRFLFLLVFSTFLDFFTGLKIYDSQTKSTKKTWLIISVVINLGFLCFFKYYNFFIDSFIPVLQAMGFKPHIWTLNLILPVGISFYTFHGLSYVFDIYNDKYTPTKNFIDYSVFVSFFPLLVAGPIERATHLLPQVQKLRRFNYAYAAEGLRQILWGLVKKVVIADNCAEYANVIFNNSSHYNGSTLLIGALLFTFQIYGDFSGYSDIALGTAKLFGFDLLMNFNFPYFSRDIAEFWRRWHISLSSWFRDYLYIPLGGSKGGTWKRIRNTFIIFIVSGFWHGANWTFIIWGALNAVYFLPLLIQNKNRHHIEIVAKGKILPSVKDVFNMGITFLLVVFGWIFFRANDLLHALNYISTLFSASIFSMPEVFPRYVFFYIGLFMVIEWWGREGFNPLNKFAGMPVSFKWAFYYSLIILVLYFSDKDQQFIYFQF
ncbi:MAG TPA: MBOAT family O-acyltransferase [Bacteroidia bacterium]|nr:MBOAT family O-acyltransferase [Bacteroidia bacterium]